MREAIIELKVAGHCVQDFRTRKFCMLSRVSIGTLCPFVFCFGSLEPGRVLVRADPRRHWPPAVDSRPERVVDSAWRS